jgi:uncharacterized protein (TIGR03546 family)
VILLKFVKDLVLALHGGKDPKHLAAGFALGAALGLTPKGTLFAAVYFLLLFLFRVDKRAALVSAAAFTPLGFALDGVAHKLGWALLSAGALHGLWTFLYNLPVVPLTRFNNTVVLGSVLLGALLYAPLYFGALRGASYYDRNLRARVEASRLVKGLKGVSIVAKLLRWLA